MASQSNVKRFDAVVIGSGQGGSPLATALAQAGKKTALIEKAHVGGTCVNEGCTPTKTIIASGRVAHLTRRARDYGVWNVPTANVAKGHKAYHNKDDGGWEDIHVAVDMQKVRQRKRDIVDSFRGGSESRVQKQEGLELIMGQAGFKDAHTLTVKLASGEETVVVAETIFINTGERPARPQLQGLERIDPSRMLDSTSVMELGEVPHHLLVLGGGYIGLEFGQLFRRLGSNVTILQRAKRLAPREDAEFGDALREILEAEGAQVLLSTTVTNAEPNNEGEVEQKLTVSYQDESGREASISGSHLLLAAGRTPNTDMLNLDAAGVKTNSRGQVLVDDKLQTAQENIYALGDVKGGPAFTHVSYDDFRIIRSNLIAPSASQSLSTISERIVPYCMFTDPQLAHVGLHEHEARVKFPNANIKTASMPMAYVARALEMDESRGLMKAIVNADTEEILGFTCLGIEGGEVMGIVYTAMLGKLPYTALQNAMYAHPTLAESLNNVWGLLK